MAAKHDPYLLETGGLRAAMARRTVETAGAFFLPYLKPGMRVLDAGCGGGSITLGIAGIVAPGEVVGLDVEARQVEAAGAAARERGLANAVFRTGSVYELPFPADSFDAAFCHAVLEHLSEPLRALAEFKRVLKPGGVLGVRAPDVRGGLLAPESPALLESTEKQNAVMDRMGGNRRVGSEIKRLLREAGFHVEELGASYDNIATPEAARAIAEANASFFRGGKAADKMVELGLADRGTLESWAQEWLRWAEDPDAFNARAMVHGVGRKP